MGLELPLILGTSSVFRREQMERLGIAFQAASPILTKRRCWGIRPSDGIAPCRG